MRWNLRLAAANRGIWQASQLQRLLAERGLVISATVSAERMRAPSSSPWLSSMRHQRATSSPVANTPA